MALFTEPGKCVLARLLDETRVDAIQYVDTFELTRLGLSIHGRTPIAQFERLGWDLPEQDDSLVEWSVQGEKDIFGQFFVRVDVKAAPTLECQRCLLPFKQPVDTSNRLQVVNSEASLENDVAQDDDSDDAIERIVGSRRFDVLALIEDEIILNLPYVPKHDVCPSVSEHLVRQDEPEADEVRPSPFAALGQLKKD